MKSKASLVPTIVLAAVASACGGGGGAPAPSPAPTPATMQLPPAPTPLKGLNCFAQAGGSSSAGVPAQWTLGMCYVASQSASGAITESASSAFVSGQSTVVASPAAPSLAAAQNKLFQVVLEVPGVPIASPGVNLSYASDRAPCSYRQEFDASLPWSPAGLTLTKSGFIRNLAGEVISQEYLDVTSFTTAAPGVDGPKAGEKTGVCENTTALPPVSPKLALNDFDFGIVDYSAGALYDTFGAVFSAGWYSRLASAGSVNKGAAQAMRLAGSQAFIGGVYANAKTIANVSTIPSGVSWNGTTLMVDISSSAWKYDTSLALAPVLPAMQLKGSFNNASQKVSGAIIGAQIESGKFEGEFNASGTEFAGRIAARIVNSSGEVANLVASFGAKLEPGQAPLLPISSVLEDLNCFAVQQGNVGANGPGEYTMRVCDVVTENANSATIEVSSSAYHAGGLAISTNKLSSTLNDLSGKSFSFTWPTPYASITGVTSFTYPSNYDPCTYYFSYDGAVTGRKSFTLTQLITNSQGMQNALIDISSFASVVPGVNGPAGGQTSGPCGNTVAEPSAAPSVGLSSFDFGMASYYAGTPLGSSVGSYYSGWYARAPGVSAPANAPLGSIAYSSSSSLAVGAYSTSGRLFNASAAPNSAAWNGSVLAVSFPSTWGYFNLFASSSSQRGSQTYSTMSPRIPALSLSGSFDSTSKKVIGTVSGTDVLNGKFEGEFNAAGTEFVGRMTVRVQSLTGQSANYVGSFALKQ